MTTPSPTRFTRFQQRYRTVERGTTVVADRQTDSAWYTLRRRG